MGPESSVQRTDFGSVVLLKVVGEHDTATSPSFHSSIEPAARPGVAVVVDLSAATFIDSTVLSSLVDAAEHADTMTIIAPEGSHSRRILEIAGLPAHPAVSLEDDDDHHGLVLRIRAQRARRQAQRLCQGAARNSGTSIEGLTTGLDLRWTPDRDIRVERAARLVGRSPAIEQAKTLIVDHYGVTRTQAFEMLVRLSQRQNVRLRVIAEDIVARRQTGGEPPGSRRPSTGPAVDA
jgi:anti-anti-sigma factor